MNISTMSTLLIISSQVGFLFFILAYFDRNLRNTTYILFSLSGTLCYLFLYQLVNVMTTGILWIFMCLLLVYFDEEIYTALFYGSLTILLYIFADYLFTVITSEFFDFQFNIIAVFYSFSIIYFLLAIFFHHFINRIIMRKKVFIRVASIGTSLTFLLYFSIIVMERFSFLKKYLLDMHSFFIVIYGVLSAIICMYIVFIKKTEYENKEEKNQIKYLIKYSEQIEKNYTEIRKFRHDYKNILISLEDYIENEDIEDLKEYFYDNIKDTAGFFEKDIFEMAAIGNLKIREIKSIVLSKLYLAYEQGVKVEINISEEIRKVSVPPIHLIRMLGIILDNAIEESQMVEDPKIMFTVLSVNDAYLFIIANKCREALPKLHVLRERGFSTKGKNRGLGLANLDELVRLTNNVYLETKIEQNQFIQIITISEV
ncbi:MULTISPECIES: GHKL domain-containing protein [unclassified Enterococcus]|uniref:sensor histidine kinase n=1 Tax=unclassified Enterococcus TaxID=2608891 RepID=UPI0013ECB9B2|nr:MULTISPECIES: GHKL domain-containing protein [unclassified Enterococcus]